MTYPGTLSTFRIASVVALCGVGCGGEGAPALAADATPDAVACTPGVHDIEAMEDAPYRLAIDDAWVYWTSAVLDGPKRIRRAPRGGGPAETMVETTNELGAFAVDPDGTLYWVEATPAGRGRIMVRRPADEARALYAVDAGLDAFAFARDASQVYWITHGTTAGGFTVSAFAGPVAGGLVTRLGVVTATFDQSIQAMAVDGDAVYWGLGAGLVYRVARTGGKPRAIVDELDGLGAFAVAGDHVYALVRDGGGSVVRVPRDGGARDVLNAAAGARWALAVAGERAYVSTADDRIVSMPVAGGEVRLEQAEGVRSAGGVAVAGAELFWANTATRSAGGAVRRVCRPDAPAAAREGSVLAAF